MSVNNLCRCCKKNLSIHGVLANTSLIFERSIKGKCIYDQILRLGLKLDNTVKKSYRICRSCQNLITRLERDMSVFKKWTDDEKDQAEEACSSEAYKYFIFCLFFCIHILEAFTFVCFLIGYVQRVYITYYVEILKVFY